MLPSDFLPSSACANNGDLKQVKYGNNDYVDYTYDDYGNISAISQNGTKNFTWQYDSTGNLYSHEDLVNNQRFVYTYDSTGRLVRQQVLDNNKKNIYSSQYGYDLNNNVSRFTSSAGGVSVTENFEYGKDNLASKYTYPSGKTTTYTYDGILRRNSTVINTTAPIQQTYKYMASARGNNAQTTKIEEEILGGNSYKYTYDANGNITSVLLKKSTESAYTKQQQFAYDELNQLIRADDLAKNRTEVYTYDNGGNILSTTVYPLTWDSLSGVTATDTTTYTYGDSNWKDKLTAYGDTPITYDAIGNPLTYRGYTLTWQNGRQLASMKYGAINIGFTYDVDGLRTSKTIPNVGLEHKYYYVGDRLQYETLGGSSALWYFYDADGNPSGIRYKDNSGTVNDYYFVCNWRGDVIQIYNASGTLVGSYTYDAWGRVTENATSADTENITETNPIRYRGYYYDTETRLYYLKSRYYDPAVKRFLNADGYVATGQSILGNNMFSYCDNNPVNREDSTGHFWKQLKAKVKNAWNGFKSWVNSTFGAGRKVSSTISKVEHQYVPDPWPITVKVGSKITQTVYKSNNYSKSVTAYIDSDIMAPMSSTAGLKVNFENVSLKINVGLDDIGIYGSFTKGNTTNSLGLKVNVSELKVGFECSTSVEWDKYNTETSYANVSVSGWALAMLYCFVTTGQPAPSPSHAYG